jgi:bifunctional ADP-heptose synthase (sugar kinase/adenylyltransferase)
MEKESGKQDTLKPLSNHLVKEGAALLLLSVGIGGVATGHIPLDPSTVNAALIISTIEIGSQEVTKAVGVKIVAEYLMDKFGLKKKEELTEKIKAMSQEQKCRLLPEVSEKLDCLMCNLEEVKSVIDISNGILIEEVVKTRLTAEKNQQDVKRMLEEYLISLSETQKNFPHTSSEYWENRKNEIKDNYSLLLRIDEKVTDIHEHVKLLVTDKIFKECRDDFIAICTDLANKEKTILVVGDVMLDHVMISSGLITDEEGNRHDYPCYGYFSEEWCPGGAGSNAVALSKVSKVILVGLISADWEGKTLTSELKRRNVEFKPVITNESHEIPTICKRYLKAHGDLELKKISRFDREDLGKMQEHMTKYEPKVLEVIKGVLECREIDAIVLDDYEKIVVTKELVRKISDIAKERNIKLFVDPKFRTSWEKFKPSDQLPSPEIEAILPDLKEAVYGAGYTIGTDVKGLTGSVKSLFKDLDSKEKKAYIKDKFKNLSVYQNSKFIPIKAGTLGCFIWKKGEVQIIKSLKVEPINSVGYGSVFDAYLIGCILMGKSIEKSALIANLAAGIKYGKPLGIFVEPVKDIIGIINECEGLSKISEGRDSLFGNYVHNNIDLIKTIYRTQS